MTVSDRWTRFDKIEVGFDRIGQNWTDWTVRTERTDRINRIDKTGQVRTGLDWQVC